MSRKGELLCFPRDRGPRSTCALQSIKCSRRNPVPLGPFWLEGAILVNAGATHPRPLWLDRLLPGGRLILPLTVTTLPGSTGQILKITRTEQGYAARFISRTAIFPCIGARELDADRRLWEALAKGGWESVCSLRRDQHEAVSTCWLHGYDFCLSTIEEGQRG